MAANQAARGAPKVGDAIVAKAGPGQIPASPHPQPNSTPPSSSLVSIADEVGRA
eukprot:CAMPEP_0119111858 /NCGR_PEP_ID=MMETSP1180-20130426/37610_1 /TAXON_ID=3052 ORGANISM="Chlamydomonas cf sp, Strain CCMP681" /NCGR_SAMPLE_ID=MMETSP1180 /ASSEMBLY_ACC=CAM_ASM_000741 /LENGTH=53 /DNA_ID=CAMNT_0007099077 /DNA_START=98 /DNA_END=259 /DNA_ORIENTATION=+